MTRIRFHWRKRVIDDFDTACTDYANDLFGRDIQHRIDDVRRKLRIPGHRTDPHYARLRHGSHRKRASDKFRPDSGIVLCKALRHYIHDLIALYHDHVCVNQLHGGIQVIRAGILIVESIRIGIIYIHRAGRRVYIRCPVGRVAVHCGKSHRCKDDGQPDMPQHIFDQF